MGQFLKHLGHQRCGNAVFFRDFVGAARMVTTMQSQMLDGYQPVISLLGKLEHRTRDFLESPTYATVLVALDNISPSGAKSEFYLLQEFTVSFLLCLGGNATKLVILRC